MRDLLIYFYILVPVFVFSQNIDIETFGKSSPFKIGGTISASSVVYNSNQRNNREAFTYYAQGNLNISYYGFSIPISYNYSNQGEQLGYQLPFNFNRLSLHPKYKWITAHIGDVNMTFSPYTLSGHQFTGGGIELTQKGLAFSAMYGRLLNAIEPGEDERIIASYQRIGCGFKTVYEQDTYTLGIATFYASDSENSININPDEEGVLPKENLVLGLEGSVAISNDLKLTAEYATTAITQDTRAQEISNGKSGLLGAIFNNKASTEYYNAYKVGLNYSFYEATLGVDYERVDPGYETLGAYFFNNDFENITLNLARPLFDNKVNLSANFGYQRDDLKEQKTNPTSRFVAAVNATYTPSERVSFTGSYSNFSTYTNVRANQFDDINDDNLLDNVTDTLNYKQISKNANLAINYILSSSKTKKENINLNYSVSDIANQQGGVVRIGDASTFHNLATSYTISFSELNLNITPAINGTYNTIGLEDATTWGPTFNVKKGFYDNKLNSTLGVSYNKTQNTGVTTNVANIRGGLSYILLEKHNFGLNFVQLFRSTPTLKGLKEFTATVSYNYSFEVKNPKIKWKKKDRKRKVKDSIITLNYKKYKYVDYAENIADSILQITKLPDFGKIPNDKNLELKGLEENMLKAIGKREDVFKEEAIAYLKSLNEFKIFQEKYNTYVLSAYYQLLQDAQVIDYQLEKDFMSVNAVNNDPKTEKTPKFKEEVEVTNERFYNHRRMLETMKIWNPLEKSKNESFITFKNRNMNKVYLMYKNEQSEDKIVHFIEYYLADLYHNKIEK